MVDQHDLCKKLHKLLQTGQSRLPSSLHSAIVPAPGGRPRTVRGDGINALARPVAGRRKGEYSTIGPASTVPGKNAMAKLKKAPGRVIGRWKQEAIVANRGASDADLAKVINETARKQGYAYTITPEKVRAKSKKKRKKRAAKPVPAAAALTNTAPAPRAAAMGAISLEDVRAVKGLVERIGAAKVQELAGLLSR